MDIQTRRLDESQNLIEVVLEGRLDLQSSETVKLRLHEIIDTAVSVIFVNLAGVFFIDSSGLSALVSGLRAARENDKDIILIGLNKQTNMIFKLTMLDRIFSIHSSLERALEAFSNK